MKRTHGPPAGAGGIAAAWSGPCASWATTESAHCAGTSRRKIIVSNLGTGVDTTSGQRAHGGTQSPLASTMGPHEAPNQLQSRSHRHTAATNTGGRRVRAKPKTEEERARLTSRRRVRPGALAAWRATSPRTRAAAPPESIGNGMNGFKRNADKHMRRQLETDSDSVWDSFATTQKNRTRTQRQVAITDK